MDYYLYHDESKVDGYWHGMLLMPCCQKERLVALLNQVRENTRYDAEIGLKKVKQKQSKITGCAHGYIQLGVFALAQSLNGKPYQAFLGKRDKGKPIYEILEKPIGAKFILFREIDNHAKMQGYSDFGSKIETTTRFGLKGGIHFLGNNEQPIHIKKMHFDGHEHNQRHLDKDRIINRITGMRAYCSFEDCPNIIDDRRSNHKDALSQSYEDCQLLQLTDLLVGSFRTVLNGSTKDIHNTITYPVKSIITRYSQGYARMKNSRWFNSFCMSQCRLENDQWIFERIDYENAQPQNQMSLF